MSSPSRLCRVLVVDDDPFFCTALRDGLGGPDMEVLAAHSRAQLECVLAEQPVDVVLLDQRLPDADGADLCEWILKEDEKIKIIFVTAFPSFDNAVTAVRQGAYDYLCKPCHPEEVDLAIRRAVRVRQLEKCEQVQDYRRGKEREGVALVGDALDGVRRLADLAGRSLSPVLITGETGTGKNVVARLVHYRSAVADGPFLVVNCAALPESLVEAELFGYERGAFTGAGQAKRGLFELADGGTILLDEIGEMPLALQAKLLNFLDEKKVRRIGGEKFRTVDVRVVAATNTPIEAALRAKTFREDLYYRLCVVRIHVPPLRERVGDIPALCGHLLAAIAAGAAFRLGADQLSALARYPWPGNVRELRNVLDRAVILSEGLDLSPADQLFPERGASPPARPEASPVSPLTPLKEQECELMRQALAAAGGNIARTARALGVSLSTLKRRIRKYNLASPGSD